MTLSLADLVLVVHLTFVIFVVGALAATWIGAALSWRWVRNYWFRTAHLLAILFVASEAIFGIACPLTIWEDALRGKGSQESSFIRRHVGRWLYYDLPEWAFTAIYVGFAAVVLITFVLVKPRKRDLPPRRN